MCKFSLKDILSGNILTKAWLKRQYKVIGLISALKMSFNENLHIVILFNGYLFISIFSATRSFALRALGFCSTSSALAVSPFSRTLKGVRILP